MPALELIETRAGRLVEAGLREGCLRGSGAELYPAALAALVRAVLHHCLEDEPAYARCAEAVATLFLEGAGVS